MELAAALVQGNIPVDCYRLPISQADDGVGGHLEATWRQGPVAVELSS